MKISYSKNYNVNRGFANLFKASVLASGLAAAYSANVLVLDCGDNREINDIQVVGNNVYQFSGNSRDTTPKFYLYDISRAGEYDTLLTPNYVTSPNGGYNLWEKFSTNGEQFIFYDPTTANSKTYLYNSEKFSNTIEIKLKDGTYPWIKNLEISGNYAMINDTDNIYILDISKASSKEITDSQITINLGYQGYHSSINGSNLVVSDNKSGNMHLYNLNAGNETAINNSHITITPKDNLISAGAASAVSSNYAVTTGVINENGSLGYVLYAFDITSRESNAIHASQIRLKDGFHNNSLSTNFVINHNNYVLVGSGYGNIIFNLNAGSEAEINGSQVRLVYANNTQSNHSTSLSLDGDTFAFTADALGGTKTIVGNVKSVTTLDDGSYQHISGFGFETLGNWVIGKNNSNNSILFNKLNAEGTIAQAIIQSESRAVYIGQNAGSNNNTLRVLGKLIANDVYIGTDGNGNNTLIFGNEAVLNADNKFDIENIYLAENSNLVFECEWNGNSEALFDFLNGADLWAWDSESKSYVLIDEDNYQDLLSITDYLDTNHMLVQVIPEPAVSAAIIGALTLALAAYRRRK